MNSNTLDKAETQTVEYFKDGTPKTPRTRQRAAKPLRSFRQEAARIRKEGEKGKPGAHIPN